MKTLSLELYIVRAHVALDYYSLHRAVLVSCLRKPRWYCYCLELAYTVLAFLATLRRREPPHKPRTTPRSHRGSAALLLWPRRTDLLFQPALRASSRVAPPEVNSAVTPCTLCFALEFIAPAAAETYARTPALRFPSRGPGWTCSPVSLLFIRLHSPSLPVCGSTTC